MCHAGHHDDPFHIMKVQLATQQQRLYWYTAVSVLLLAITVEAVVGLGVVNSSHM